MHKMYMTIGWKFLEELFGCLFKVYAARQAIGDSDFFLVARTDARGTSAKRGMEESITRANLYYVRLNLPELGKACVNKEAVCVVWRNIWAT